MNEWRKEGRKERRKEGRNEVGKEGRKERRKEQITVLTKTVNIDAHVSL